MAKVGIDATKNRADVPTMADHETLKNQTNAKIDELRAELNSRFESDISFKISADKLVVTNNTSGKVYTIIPDSKIG